MYFLMYFLKILKVLINYVKIGSYFYLTYNNNNNNNNNVYFKSLTYTNVLFKLEMKAQQNKIF